MRYILLIILIALCLPSIGLPFETNLKFIRSIGDDESDEYTFFMISGAVLSNEKDIFVIDPKGYCVSKYSWDGVFKKRVGQLGRGPMDFMSLNSIRFFNKRLYIVDSKNRRISSLDTDLGDFQSINYLNLKYKGKIFFRIPGDIIVLGNDRFLGYSLLTTENESKEHLFIFDSKGKVEKVFFDHMPTKEPLSIQKTSVNIILSKVSVGVDHKQGTIIVTPSFPGNTVDFHLFDLMGNSLKTFSYKQENNFRFPMALINKTTKKGEKVDFSMIETVSIFDDYFLVLFVEVEGAEELGPSLEGKLKYYLLIFDKDGEFRHKTCLEKPLLIYHISPEGYVLAKDATGDDEVEKLLIYKLELKK